MANTKTNARVVAGRQKIVQYLTLAYVDAATESDYIVYDSSVVATALGITDPLTSTIMEVYATVSSATTARVWLEWDATTDVVALDLPAGRVTKACFKEIGGVKNQGGTGVTGDILLNATGLSTGDIITLVIVVKPN